MEKALKLWWKSKSFSQKPTLIFDHRETGGSDFLLWNANIVNGKVLIIKDKDQIYKWKENEEDYEKLLKIFVTSFIHSKCSISTHFEMHLDFVRQ